MSDFRGWRSEVIIRPVEVIYRRMDEFIDIDPVQTIHPNCIKFATQPGILSPREGADSTFPAKYMVDIVGLIIDQISLPCR